jgi:hypothetical protein
MSALVDGLGVNGRMMVVGASTDPIEVTPVQLISATGASRAGRQESRPTRRIRCGLPS